MENTNNDLSNLKNLAAKMISIMKDVEYIQKTGYNTFHRYKYATEADVSAAFAKAMRAHNVFMFSSILERECKSYKTRGDKDSFLVTVKLEITFIDADSGESFVSIFYGDGSDSDDKGIYKAITGAQKYALMKTFLVETGNDPERDESAPSINKDELIKSLKVSASNGTEVFREHWKKLSSEERSIGTSYMPELKSLCEKADNS